MEVFVVYDRPIDAPEHVVVRRWSVDGGVSPTGLVETFADLAAARLALADRGLVCIPRSPGDDPVIVESWL